MAQSESRRSSRLRQWAGTRTGTGSIGLLLGLGLATNSVASAPPVPVGCGGHAVASMARFSGLPVTADVWATITTTCGSETESLASVVECLNALGLRTQAVAASADEIVTLRGPKVVHLESDEGTHFSVCVGGVPGGDVVCWDASGPKILAWDEFLAKYSGKAAIMANQAAPGPCMAEVGICDLGGDVVGGLVESRLTIENRGDASLEASVSYVSCSCTVAGEAAITVDAGASTTVPVRMKAGLGGDSVSYALLDTNDALWPKRPVVLRARIPRQLHVTPDKLVVAGSARDGGEATVRLETPPGWALSDLTTDMDGVSAELVEDELTEAGGRYRVRVSLPSGHATGNTEGVLSLRTGVATPARLEIPTTVVVTGVLRCVPAAAFVGLCPVGKEARADVSVRRTDGVPLSVRNASVSGPEFLLTGPVEADDAYVLQVRTTPDQVGPIRGEITIETDVPGEEKLVIPITGHAQEAE